MDYEEEDEYSSGDDGYASLEGPTIVNDKPYKILNEETLKQLQQNDISEVSDLLGVTRGIACSLLLRHKWTVDSVLDDWFTDEKLSQSFGGGVPLLQNNLYCKICMETVSHTLSAACGHVFCTDCWVGYIAAAGAACLTLRCPEPKCTTVAGLDVIQAVSPAEDGLKFRRYLYESYVEASPARKWCPGPGCEFAVEFFGGKEDYDVTCDCSFKFCWQCTEEQHRPVSCGTVAKWAEKNTSEADNKSWIVAYTKACPNCNQNIEKNQGCCHMTCKCRYEFCWNCMQKWKNYGHTCNEYTREKEAVVECSLMEARAELARYSFYFERWALNHRSREIARADAARARSERVPALSAAQGVKETELEFVVEVWDQIVECRRVLKWSYAYGYYVRREERKKKEIFEFLQGDAERSLERLHHCAEKEGANFAGKALEEFAEYRAKLVNLTKVTAKFFQNLVRALENDLSEVEGA
ncbi:probable E3 ubiquitin-protein ligase ARI8 [Salvia hispanica]|uniref:probable E3 ubiquitin-protein ligase ARI8 n=1 Tax=Salvia hispanica TaxID=49212 RepID=UPI0020099DF8|nr:probable E3 ubiquitin-protein ligase ARI8 [Salvia hispanica]